LKNSYKKNFSHIIGRILLYFLLIIILFLLILSIYNKVMMKKEAKIYENPIGQYIEIDGHKMCLYTEGAGAHTLIFLSGSGTSSPVLDFKSIYSRLSDDFRIVVIEKFGYGFSDVSNTERDFETILRQDRQALSKAGIEGPFILCPHSMSGLEAILWSQLYPKEVEAIVGLDMSVPESYENMQSSRALINFAYALTNAARKLGLLRLFSDKFLISSTILSDEERSIYRSIIYSKLLNADVKSEANYTDEACAKIRSLEKPTIPILYILSDGSGGTGSSKETWRSFAYSFAENCPAAKFLELDCPHYVHDFESQRIEKAIRDFILLGE